MLDVSFFDVLLIGIGIEDFLINWLDEEDANVAEVVARVIIVFAAKDSAADAAFALRM